MEIVDEVIIKEEEQIEEETEIQEEEYVAIATCAICSKEEKIDEEQIKWLSEITFKRNPEARGARIQDALNFVIGDRCLDGQSHAFVFDEKWFTKTTEKAVIVKEKNEKLSNNIENKHMIEEQIENLQKELEKIINENNSIYDEVPELRREFERLTGTQNYLAWL